MTRQLQRRTTRGGAPEVAEKDIAVETSTGYVTYRKGDRVRAEHVGGKVVALDSVLPDDGTEPNIGGREDLRRDPPSPAPHDELET